MWQNLCIKIKPPCAVSCWKRRFSCTISPNGNFLKILPTYPTQAHKSNTSDLFPIFSKGISFVWCLTRYVGTDFDFYYNHTRVEFHHISPSKQSWNFRFWKDSPSDSLPKLLEMHHNHDLRIPSPRIGTISEPFQLGGRIFKHWASLSSSTWHVALRMALVGTRILKCVAESQGISTSAGVEVKYRIRRSRWDGTITRNGTSFSDNSPFEDSSV